MASFYDMEQSDVARNLQAVFTGETEPLRKYGLDLTQATLKEWAKMCIRDRLWAKNFIY